MLSFITLARWWKYATHFTVLGISLPRPQWFTFISGVLTSGRSSRRLLAYTFEGISIVFMMLLMRGGVPDPRPAGRPRRPKAPAEDLLAIVDRLRLEHRGALVAFARRPPPP